MYTFLLNNNVLGNVSFIFIFYWFYNVSPDITLFNFYNYLCTVAPLSRLFYPESGA